MNAFCLLSNKKYEALQVWRTNTWNVYQDRFDSGAGGGMTDIDEKGMVILLKEVVYLSPKTAGSPDLFTHLS